MGAHRLYKRYSISSAVLDRLPGWIDLLPPPGSESWAFERFLRNTFVALKGQEDKSDGFLLRFLSVCGSVAGLATFGDSMYSSFLFLVASLLLVARPGAPSSVLATSSDALCS